MTTSVHTLRVDMGAVYVDAQIPVLRERLGLTGTKNCCEPGACGARTVRVDGEAIFTILTPFDAVVEKPMTTIEGLAPTGEHELRQDWIAELVPQDSDPQSGRSCAPPFDASKFSVPMTGAVVAQAIFAIAGKPLRGMACKPDRIKALLAP
jgi:aerobic-type carbon monoxide dehydrogenase small subunit (CoxS/CutS family)